MELPGVEPGSSAGRVSGFLPNRNHPAPLHSKAYYKYLYVEILFCDHTRFEDQRKEAPVSPGLLFLALCAVAVPAVHPGQVVTLEGGGCS